MCMLMKDLITTNRGLIATLQSKILADNTSAVESVYMQIIDEARNQYPSIAMIEYTIRVVLTAIKMAHSGSCKFSPNCSLDIS